MMAFKNVTIKEISSVPCRCQGFLDVEVAADAKVLSAIIATLPDQTAGQALEKLCTLYPLDKMMYSDSRASVSEQITAINLSHLRRIRGKRRTSDDSQLEVEVNKYNIVLF